VALSDRNAIDEQYFQLARNLLRVQISGDVRRAAFATHDPRLIRKVTELAAKEGISKEQVEVQMLYGIQRMEQQRLANGGWRSGVLIAYGNYWYPWFVRRLAERPANLWLLLRNFVGD
jgi:proline dehydrogenase